MKSEEGRDSAPDISGDVRMYLYYIRYEAERQTKESSFMDISF